MKSSSRVVLVLLVAVFLIGCASLMTDTPRLYVSSGGTQSTNNELKIDYAFSAGPGWVGIHNRNFDGTPGELIGYAPVKDGLSLDVIVTLDPSKARGELIAILHKDGGEIGKFEYPGPDEPAMSADGALVSARFDYQMSTFVGNEF